jgi:predicted O-methyltransferase YrrM
MSSYEQNDYGQLITSLVRLYQPKFIVEYGILQGYSLKALMAGASSETRISAFDIFDEFPYHHAPENIDNQFSDDRVFIGYQDFYEDSQSPWNIDFLHIDIANTGETYQLFFDKYLQRMSPNGVCILEGGSQERDNYYWMVEYNKPKIVPVIEWARETFKEKLDIFTFNPFPSMTIVKLNGEM